MGEIGFLFSEVRTSYFQRKGMRIFPLIEITYNWFKDTIMKVVRLIFYSDRLLALAVYFIKVSQKKYKKT